MSHTANICDKFAHCQWKRASLQHKSPLGVKIIACLAVGDKLKCSCKGDNVQSSNDHVDIPINKIFRLFS